MIISTVILLSIACGLAVSSGIHTGAATPVVTAASSQYFERTFNRLVAVPPLIPAAPGPPLLEPVIPVAPPPPVVVEATRTSRFPVDPTNPPQNSGEPNIAIAIATAYAAAPVSTILLPPYPFGLPPSFGSFPQEAPSDNSNFNKESTTQSTTRTQVTTTEREQEATTPVPSNIDNSFAQALPSNENVNFKFYGPPLTPPALKPLKLTTSVEVVPVPLTYIAPPPLGLHHHHHHHGHHHQALKTEPHVHTFIPKNSKIIIRPISRPFRIRTVRVIPASLVSYKSPHLVRKVSARNLQNIKLRSRDTEPTTFRPINRPGSKPPRL